MMRVAPSHSALPACSMFFISIAHLPTNAIVRLQLTCTFRSTRDRSCVAQKWRCAISVVASRNADSRCRVRSTSVQSVKGAGQNRAAEKPSGASGATKANQWDLSNAVMAAQAIRAGDVRQAKRWLETDTQSRLGTEDRLREKLQASMGARGVDSRVVVAGK